MIHRQKEAWRKFLEAKIAQEEGREEEALRNLEQALEIDPSNEHFRGACNEARRRISRPLARADEELVAQVQRRYEQFTSGVLNWTGERVDGLKEMLAQLDGRAAKLQLRRYTRGLHCA